MHSRTAESKQSSHFLSQSVIFPGLGDMLSGWKPLTHLLRLDTICMMRSHIHAHTYFTQACLLIYTDWITVTEHNYQHLVSKDINMLLSNRTGILARMLLKKDTFFLWAKFSQHGVSWSDRIKILGEKKKITNNQPAAHNHCAGCKNRLLI